MPQMTTIHLFFMEFEFPSTLTLLISLLGFLFVAFKFYQNKSANSLNLIPGPTKLPLIGNLYLFFGKPLLHHVLRDLAIKYGGLMHIQLGEIPFLVVSSAEMAKPVLKTHDISFSNRPHLSTLEKSSYNFTSIVLSPYGAYWRHLRKICTLELLSMKRVQFFKPIREEENTNLAQWIASNEGLAINLSKRIYGLSFNITTRSLIGKKSDDQESVTTIIKKTVELVSGFSIANLYPSSTILLPLITGTKFKMERNFQKIDRLFDSIINQHKSDTTGRSEDLLDVLLKCQQDDQAEVHLTTDNIKAVLLDLFVAGSDTSATVAIWAMSEMMKNPTILKRAQEEVRKVFDGKGYVDEEEFHELIYLKLVIKEALRMHPPAPISLPRYNNEKCEINGYEIPAKTLVLINTWAVARDPNHWNDAEKFIPERFIDSSIDYKGNNLEYIPFGAGRRICVGMSFGIATVESILAMLLYHFDWGMPNGIKNEELDMTELFGATVMRKHELLLVPTVRRPLKLLE